MTRWVCDHRDCTSSSIGEGNAAGLRAIGWYVEIGPVIFCPRHRPDAGPRVEGGGPDCRCWQCLSDREALRLQDLLGALN